MASTGAKVGDYLRELGRLQLRFCVVVGLVSSAEFLVRWRFGAGAVKPWSSILVVLGAATLPALLGVYAALVRRLKRRHGVRVARY